jgi:hypothetical protein
LEEKGKKGPFAPTGAGDQTNWCWGDVRVFS